MGSTKRKKVGKETQLLEEGERHGRQIETTADHFKVSLCNSDFLEYGLGSEKRKINIY